MSTNPYTRPVKFTETGQYGDVPDEEDDVYTIEEFKEVCACGGFIDYDGHGHPVKDGKADPSVVVRPSALKDIPEDATHVVWYNR